MRLPLALLLLLLLCSLQDAWGMSNDQLCVQVHHGMCTQHSNCAVSEMIDVCDKADEVCCKRRGGAPAGTQLFPTSQIPLFLATCPSTVESRVGSIWVYADGRENVLYLYPDLPDEYYDCDRYQMVTLTERARVLSLSLQAGSLAPESLYFAHEEPRVRMRHSMFQFQRPAGYPREDQLYPLTVAHADLHLHEACSAPLDVLLLATLRVHTKYSQSNITVMGGSTPILCNGSLVPHSTEAREQCDALNYHLGTHRYEDGCKALGDPSDEACRSTCTVEVAGAEAVGDPHTARGLCLGHQQCLTMGSIGEQECTQCSGSAGVCCVFAVNPDDVLAAQGPSPGTSPTGGSSGGTGREDLSPTASAATSTEEGGAGPFAPVDYYLSRGIGFGWTFLL